MVSDEDGYGSDDYRPGSEPQVPGQRPKSLGKKKPTQPKHDRGGGSGGRTRPTNNQLLVRNERAQTAVENGALPAHLVH